MRLPSEVEQALGLHATTDARRIHELELALARLLVPQGPTAGQGQLDVAAAYLSGLAGPAELKNVQQDCWSYVGSLACGCSQAESAVGAAFLACLNGDAAVHTLRALREQVERALHAGIAAPVIVAALAGSSAAD